MPMTSLGVPPHPRPLSRGERGEWLQKSFEKERAGKFFICRSGSGLPRGARANLEKSRDKMFDEIEKT